MRASTPRVVRGTLDRIGIVVVGSAAAGTHYAFRIHGESKTYRVRGMPADAYLAKPGDQITFRTNGVHFEFVRDFHNATLRGAQNTTRS